MPSSSESTRSYRRGGRSLEDGPSARQPVPRRSTQVGALGLWSEGSGRAREVELVRSRCRGIKASPHCWGTCGPRWPPCASPCPGAFLPTQAQGCVQLQRAQASRSGSSEVAQAVLLPKGGGARLRGQAAFSRIRVAAHPALVHLSPCTEGF